MERAELLKNQANSEFSAQNFRGAIEVGQITLCPCILHTNIQLIIICFDIAIHGGVQRSDLINAPRAQAHGSIQ